MHRGASETAADKDVGEKDSHAYGLVNVSLRSYMGIDEGNTGNLLPRFY